MLGAKLIPEYLDVILDAISIAWVFIPFSIQLARSMRIGE